MKTEHIVIILIAGLLLYQINEYVKHKKALRESSISDDYAKTSFWIKRGVLGVIVAIVLMLINYNINNNALDLTVLTIILLILIIDFFNSLMTRTIYYSKNKNVFFYHKYEFKKNDIVSMTRTKNIFNGEIKLRNGDGIIIPIESIKYFHQLL